MVSFLKAVIIFFVVPKALKMEQCVLSNFLGNCRDWWSQSYQLRASLAQRFNFGSLTDRLVQSRWSHEIVVD